MKKGVIIFTVAFLVLIYGLCAGATDVIIDGRKVDFTADTGYPFIDGSNRTLVPLRAAMEALGATVSWDNEVRCAIVTKGSTTVNCYIDEACIYRNGVRIPNDTAAIIRDSRTFLPIRAVAEALDATVSWNGNVIIETGSALNLAYNIENGSSHVSNLWKAWEDALSAKNNGNYQGAIEQIKALAPDFVKKHDANSNAMLFKHLGECYSYLNMNEEAAACFKRESEYWLSVSKRQEYIDADRRSSFINSYVQIFAKTDNPLYKHRKYFSAPYEPQNGIYLGAYAEGDSAVHNPYSTDKFYMNNFPQLVGKDMASYLIYLPSNTSLSTYQSHIDIAKQKNKIIQLAIEPVSLNSIHSQDESYIRIAKEIESSGAKFLVRFAGEMNELSCPWYTKDYNLYIEKFRIVADIFHQYAPSAGVIWSPNFYPADTISLYYPGDAYVDYVGISSYWNHQPQTDPLGQGIDRERWSSQLEYICSLYAHKKPIIISECGASYMDYTTHTDITSLSSARLYDFLTYLPIKYPAVKAVYIFDSDRTNYLFSLSKNQVYLDAYKRGIESNLYLQSPDAADSASQYYELGNNVHAEAKSTQICSFVKTVENDISYVVYFINGVEVATAYAIPYSVNIDFSSFKNSTVTIQARAFSSSGAPVAQNSCNIYID